jgi:flavin-dependent dehydrogenase
VKRTLDAVIVGGGPAGSCAGLLLARLGWQVALIERRPRHREKACGYCLNVRAGGPLRRAGLLDEVKQLALGATRRVRVHLERRSAISAQLPECPVSGPGLLVDRGQFDQLLLDRAADAGVRVFQPATARLDGPNGGPITVQVHQGGSTRQIRGRLVVGADGLRSAVARVAGLADGGRNGRKYGFALDVPAPGRVGAIEPGTIEMFVVAGGYLGVVNRGGGGLHVAGLVGCGAPDDSGPFAFVERVAGRFEMLAEAGLHRLDRHRCRRLLGAGPMPSRPKRVAGDGVVLVGDAAGYIEPFTGEGMSWALESAEILATVAADVSPGGWTPAASRRYRRTWVRRIGRRQRRCALLARVLARPVVSRALVGVASRRKALLNALVRQAVMA